MKASKVMANYTNRYASTIHRRVGVYGEDEEGTKEIYDDIVIVDETSMCDVFILSKLFYAIRNSNARILFVGDDFQLPSVGVGNFLYDVLNSNNVTISKLTKVFRQDDGGILNVATDVREGKSFLNGSDDGRIVFGKDCVFWLTDQEYMRDGVIANYKKVIKKFNQDDVIILTPTNKGKLGTVALNKEIQKIANPASISKKEKSVGKKEDPTIFRVGDLVMNTVNTYDIETIDGGRADIFNGDTGKIIDIDENEKVFVIEIDSIVVKIKFGDMLGRFIHSWVTTIHKCVTEDTWIYTNKGLKQLKDLNNGAKIGEFKEIDGDIMVYNGKHLEKPKSFYNDGVSEGLKIRTNKGYSLSATKNHGVDIYRNGTIKRIEAKDLKIGDKLVVSVNNNIYGNNVDLPTSWQDRSNLHHNTILYNRPLKMSKDFARFLGFMVADGTIGKNVIKLSKRNNEVVEDFKNLVNNLFQYSNSNIKLRNLGDYIYEVSSADIMDFCKNIDGIQPHNKFVPQCILESDKEYQIEFLKSLFEDGTVNVKNGRFDHIEFSAKSELLIDQVRMMLLNMGIISSKRKKVKNDLKYNKLRTQYVLYLYKFESQLFYEKIGFISHIKNSNLKLCMKDYGYTKQGYINDKKYGEIYLDEIISIENKHIETYCLEMPKTHKFIQNGLHAWNSQGSQYKVVIVVADRSMTYQLNANLLYTGFSRAQDYMLVLTQPQTINRAMKKFANMERRSFMQDLLEEFNNLEDIDENKINEELNNINERYD